MKQIHYSVYGAICGIEARLRGDSTVTCTNTPDEVTCADCKKLLATWKMIFSIVFHCGRCGGIQRGGIVTSNCCGAPVRDSN